MIGGLGLPELLIVIIILVCIVFVVGALFSRKKRGAAGQSDRLKELQKLKQEGLITEEEFSRKRKEILDAL